MYKYFKNVCEEFSLKYLCPTVCSCFWSHLLQSPPVHSSCFVCLQSLHGKSNVTISPFLSDSNQPFCVFVKFCWSLRFSSAVGSWISSFCGTFTILGKKWETEQKMGFFGFRSHWVGREQVKYDLKFITAVGVAETYSNRSRSNNWNWVSWNCKTDCFFFQTVTSCVVNSFLLTVIEHSSLSKLNSWLLCLLLWILLWLTVTFSSLCMLLPPGMGEGSPSNFAYPLWLARNAPQSEFDMCGIVRDDMLM